MTKSAEDPELPPSGSNPGGADNGGAADSHRAAANNGAHGNDALFPLAVGAVGVVFGDIGTSPLYAIKEAFGSAHGLTLNHDNMLGVLSLMFWSLVAIVTVKYVVFMMRADNRGEGGIMALMALVLRGSKGKSSRRVYLMALGIFGAALFYGDGMITPAISVLSAMEGLEVATPLLKPYVIPLTLLVITVLFTFQQMGTAKVAALFGPVMVVWFAVLATLGVVNIVNEPQVLAALNPMYALRFFANNGYVAFLTLGAVVLCVTGAEALYADMGHFGRRPIRLAWLWFVFPALLLNYFGQGALLLHDAKALQHPFFHLAPDWALFPMVVLATLATVIASQATISGAYSLTRQAIQLGYCPRLLIRHTSEKEIGQVYLPWINWGLYIAVVGLVLGFGSSSKLAGAYGIAVTATMAVDSVLVYFIMTRVWHWSWPRAALISSLFLCIDLPYLAANAVKILDGGWFPLLVGVIAFTLMATWKRGREILFERMSPGGIAVDPFISSLMMHPPQRVAGTSVFLTATQEGVPHALLHNLNHNKVLHERVVLLTVISEDIPHVPDGQRVEILPLGHEFYRILVHYGFKDEPDLPRALELCEPKGLTFSAMETSYFLSRQTLVPTHASPGMALWREKLFAIMSRNAADATEFFRIPTNRVVELGSRVEL